MKPIIFLDIDGVLNSWHRQPPGHPSSRQPDSVVILPECVTHLNTLTEVIGAELVMSSSWRMAGDMRPILAKRGVSGCFHADWRTDGDGPNRAAEIERWWHLHNWPPYVVIDDWLAGIQKLHGNLVIVDSRTGLVADDVGEALAVLRDPIQILAREAWA